jgi:hypothetical protein
VAISERHRLARIFGFEPVKPWGALGGAALLAAIPGGALLGTWIASGALTVGITAMIVDENRKIADGLQEVRRWGFSVEGYRAWLLAHSPAFDLELRRDVATDLITASLTAVDGSIIVERRSERVVRVIMRRIEMEGGENQPTFLVGDRKRLFEVHDRVLAPLHADVGIVAMRMGDRDTLTALVASPRSATADAAFREQALVAPPDLQSLAHTGTSHLRPPQEASSMKLRTDRLLYATGQVPTTAGKLMTLIVVGLICGGGIGATIGVGGALGILFGTGAGTFGAWLARRGDHRRLERALAASQQYPFPVEGYENWLLSGRPQLDVEFAAPVDDGSLEDMIRTTNRNMTLTWLSDRVIRIECEPVMHMAAQGIKSFWGGDPDMFALIVRRVLEPLHGKVGIVAVRMGGYLDRRA